MHRELSMRAVLNEFADAAVHLTCPAHASLELLPPACAAAAPMPASNHAYMHNLLMPNPHVEYSTHAYNPRSSLWACVLHVWGWCNYYTVIACMRCPCNHGDVSTAAACSTREQHQIHSSTCWLIKAPTSCSAARSACTCSSSMG